jgi:hypothetical protein
MKIALTRIIAAAGAADCGRHTFARALLLGCAVACASLPAMAEQERDREGARAASVQPPPPNRDGRRAERIEPPPPSRQADTARPEQRQYDARAFELRADEQRRQLQQQDAQHGDGGRRGRLTPDERRELRRQINEAGIDLYPNTPRR